MDKYTKNGKAQSECTKDGNSTKKWTERKQVFKMLTIVYFVYNLINVYTVKQLFNLFTWSSNYMILLCNRLLWSLDHVRGYFTTLVR